MIALIRQEQQTHELTNSRSDLLDGLRTMHRLDVALKVIRTNQVGRTPEQNRPRIMIIRSG